MLIWLSAALLAAPASAQSAAAAAAQSPTVPSCPVQPRYPLPSDASALGALSAQLEGLASNTACLADAYFLAYRGSVLMALGQPAEAIEPLERALLTQPDLPGAQLDLAQALAQQGDRAAAAALLDALQARSDLPPPLRKALSEQRVALLTRPEAVPLWHHRLQISSMVGTDSNLNNAPAASELTLTFPQGSVTLPLAPGSLPQRGAGVISNLQWQGLRPSGTSLWVLQADLRGRLTNRGETRYSQSDLAATWLQNPDAQRQWIGRVGSTRLDFGGATLMKGVRASIQHQWGKLAESAFVGAAAECRPGVGLEIEDRHFPTSPELAGFYQGGAFSLLCTTPKRVEANGGGAAQAASYGLQLRVGEDQPRDELRPGGVQRRSELRAQWEGALRSPLPGLLGAGRLGLQWASTRQVDGSGYSPLLSNNAPRRTVRHALLAEASWPIGAGLSALVSAEAAIQRSNLAAFSARQRSLYMGLRWELM